MWGKAGKSSSIAEQPVGFASGRQAALERVARWAKLASGKHLILETTKFLKALEETCPLSPLPQPEEEQCSASPGGAGGGRELSV